MIELSKAAVDVLAERRRQIESEGWTPQHDDEHGTGSLGTAGACYALMACAPAAENSYWYWERAKAAEHLWPWDREWFKPASLRRMLVKAAALLLAEIERLDRAEQPSRHAATVHRLAEASTTEVGNLTQTRATQ